MTCTFMREEAHSSEASLSVDCGSTAATSCVLHFECHALCDLDATAARVAMEAEHDELSTNPFFVALMQNAALVADIGRLSALVCVPSSESLKLCTLTPDFLSTHVLVADAESTEPDVYRTLHGESVVYSGGRIQCRSGFARPRTVMVVYEETSYDDDFNAMRVLRTNFALTGKIPLAYYKQVATQASVDIHTLNARTLPEHQAVLCRLCMPAATAAAMASFSPEQALANIGVSPSSALSADPALPPVFASLSRFIVSFNTSYVLVKGFVEHAGSKVKDACERIKEELLAAIAATAAAEASSSSKSGAGAKLSRVTSMEASAAIEACIFAGIQRKLFAGLIELYRAEEARTHAFLASAANISMQELGVRPELVCEPALAVEHLQQALNGTFAVTPLQKLSVLEDTTKLLTQAVDAQLAHARSSAEPGSEKQDTALAADDMLPFWLYLLVHAAPAHLHANVAYMQHCQPASTFLNTAGMRVHLANLQGALQFVDSGKLGGQAAALADALPEGGTMAPRRVRATSTIVTNSFANLNVRDSPHHAVAAAGLGNPFSARAASSSHASAPSHSRKLSSQREGSTLASITDEYEQLQESMRPASARLSVSTQSSPHAQSRSLTQTHALHARQSSLQLPTPTVARSELPPARSSHSLSRSHTLSGAQSAAVAAVAASSVARMGDFLSSLQQQDDGVTGRLAQRPVSPPLSDSVRAQMQQQQRMLQEQRLARRGTGPAAGSRASTAQVLQLDADDLPPLIVQRTSAASSSRRF